MTLKPTCLLRIGWLSDCHCHLLRHWPSQPVVLGAEWTASFCSPSEACAGKASCSGTAGLAAVEVGHIGPLALRSFC
eukprot:2754393-Amphidinium_carterae.2